MGNNSASILARLKNESIKRGIPNQQMITLFAGRILQKTW